MPRFYNTLTRQKDDLSPLDPPQLKIYACGPTVYDYAHIGNFRSFVWMDVLHRYLDWRGYDVTLVVNITDVDDKTIARAREEGVPLEELTGRFTEAFLADLESLGVRPADRYPKATDHIEEMAELVRRLLDRGIAYRSDGAIYFRVSEFDEYGCLARLDPDELRATGRAEADADKKEDPRDFVLWKEAREGEPSWDTVVGPGRPGWHIECSAMSTKYLGPTFDLHLGGIDLVFPHHENELAQSVAGTGGEAARTWLHCAHLVVEGTKMSKSLGNQYTLRDLLERGEDPTALRFLFASVHYRKQLNFTWEALGRAASAVERLREFVLRAEQELAELEETGSGADGEGGDGPVAASLERARSGFRECLDDDLNTSGALGAMFTLVREVNAALDRGEAGADELRAAVEWIREVDSIWNVLPDEWELVEREVEVDGERLRAVGPPLDDELVDMIVRRMRARARRDFETADRLRDRLEGRGVVVEDGPHGVRWRRAAPAEGATAD